MSGIHLEQVGTNHWRLSGRCIVDIERVENVDKLTIRWQVTESDIPRGEWSTAHLALAHAYTLAGGNHARIP